MSLSRMSGWRMSSAATASAALARHDHVRAVLRQRRLEQQPRVFLVVHDQDVQTLEQRAVDGRRGQRHRRFVAALLSSDGMITDGRRTSKVAPVPAPGSAR